MVSKSSICLRLLEKYIFPVVIDYVKTKRENIIEQMEVMDVLSSKSQVPA